MSVGREADDTLLAAFHAQGFIDIVQALLNQKDVAVTYKSLNIARTHDGAAIDHITVAANKKDLSQAADFKTLSQQRTETAVRRPVQDTE